MKYTLSNRKNTPLLKKNTQTNCLCHKDSCSRCDMRQSGSHVCCTQITHLSVQVQGISILNDVNLHIHCGELTAIVGRNGAGKTTFLKALLDEIPHTGDILFMQDKAVCARRPRFGYVPQSLAVDAGSPVSVGDMVLSCISHYPVWLPLRKKDTQRIQNVLSITKSQNLAKRRVCELSGGELQSVMLALALNPLPDILLLDEPVSGVDRTGLALFYDIVSELRHTHDITILLISHDLDLVAQHADKVVLIDRGIAAEGTPQQVYRTPEFIKTFGHIVIDGDEN